MKKRLLSLLLVLGMLTSLFPAQVWAENGRTPTAAPTQASVQETQEPASAQEPTEGEEPKQAAPAFSDIKAGDWYYEAVCKAAELGLFSGDTEDTFAPDGSMTRGMFVTVLAKMAGVQAGDYATPAAFGDVSADAYYAPYVAWALEHGITSGTGDGLFSPEETVDRQQMAVFLVRLFDTMGVEPDTKTDEKTDEKTEPTQESQPADLDQVDDWARDAVCKLWNLGVLRGDGVNFAPRESATRAEAATMLTKTCEVVPEAAQALVKETPAEVPVETPKPAGGGSSGGGSSGGGGSSVVYYTLSFETNGGGTLAPRSVSAGSALDGLPVPYIAEKIFKGWYYDEALTRPVSATDRAEQSITLYAGYQDTDELAVAQTPSFVSATDVSGNFSIIICSSLPSATAEDVLNALTVKNLNDINLSTTELAAVTREGDNFVLKAAGGAFEAGASFKVTLLADSLTFEGQLATVREYNFTTAKEEVLNVQLTTGMKYIPIESLTEITKDGEETDSLSLALYSVDQKKGTTSIAKKSTGTFLYSGETPLEVGDTAAVYAGVRPDERTLETTGEDNGDLAYVKITAVNDELYTYESAEAEEVIFTPDMLPIPEDADTDGDAENASITVPNSELDFSGDDYANVGLDSRTTVDAGDFLIFYEGTFDVESTQGAESIRYARVDSVSVDVAAATTTITYTAVEWEKVQTAMDVYATQQVKGEEMLEDVNVKQVEEQAELQALESGFVEDAGNYLASLALATDSFTQLSEEFELTDFNLQPVTTDDALESFSIDSEPLLFAAQEGAAQGSNVDVFLDYISASISTDMKHFDVSGLSLTLEVTIRIVVDMGEGTQVTITVTGAFEQELRLDIGVSSQAVWKVAGIFPYIADYSVTANIDLYDYTNIEVNATMVTQQMDAGSNPVTKEDYSSLADDIKRLLEQDESGSDSMAQNLAQKYKAMLETESDWVDLIKEPIFEKEFHIPPQLPIVAVMVGVDFVVSANAVISVGVDFSFQEAKRYVYNISVYSGSISNDVIDLSKETYELDVYVMGKIQLRMGVKARFAVGLISTKIASVGFSAEAGAYVKLYGFFYYQLKYTQDTGRTQRSLGALLVEVGIYIEIDFEAQAFGDVTSMLSTKLTLYEKEWPLWTAGDQRSVLDFTTAPADMPSVKLKQYVRNTILPDTLFEMSYLDLIEGEDNTAVYDDKNDFVIEITNSKFKYEPESNTITVDPAADDLELKGQMIITWKAAPLAFSSTPIQRKLDLSWDNLRDGYVIVPITNGGSYIPILVESYGSAVTPFVDPTRAGYVFGGWYADEGLNTPYVFPETMPNTDTNIYAKWNPATDTPYRVEHYQQILGTSEYALFESEEFTGITNETVSPDFKSYTGFSGPKQKEELVIAADGGAVLRYYYDRITYTVTFKRGAVGGADETYELKYGGRIAAPVFGAKGYKFEKWDKDVLKNMGAENLTYTATWSRIEAPYRVEYYAQQLDETYVLQGTDECKTSAATVTVDSVRNDTAYGVAGGLAYEKTTVKGEAVTDSVPIDSDGNTVAKVYYGRLEHTATFHPENGGADIVSTYPYGAEIAAPDVTRAGYTFDEWEPTPGTMGTEDTAYTAQWTANDGIAYKVEHYQQNANDDGYTLFDTENLTGTTDTTVSASGKEYDYFQLKEGAAGAVDSGTVAADGSLVLKLYYDRKTFTLTYFNGEAQYGTAETYRYGQAVTTPTGLEKTGYNFGGWLLNGEPFNGTMPAENVSLYANWLASNEFSYTVNYWKNGLKGAQAEFVRSAQSAGTFGDEVTVTPADTYEGFTAPAAQTVIIGENTVVDFYYTRNTYAVTWDYDGGTVSGNTSGAEELEYQQPIMPPTPVKAGYSCTWSPTVAATMGTQPLSYTAVWTPKPYTIKFVSAGSTVNPITQAYGTAVTPPAAPTRTGYTFTGWDAAVPATMPLDGATLTARWSPVSYSIAYKNLEGAANHAGNPVSYTVESGTLSLNAASKTGYTFKSWYTDQALTKPADSFTPDKGSLSAKTFYAKWEANPYSVTFNNSLKASLAKTKTQTFEYDVAKALDANSFTNTGYIFAGWTATENSKTVQYANGATVKNLAPMDNITLYAVWTPVTYGITYQGIDVGAAGHGNPASYTIETKDITLADPTSIKAGYQFLGWYNGAGSKVTAITKGSYGAVSLTAKWAHGGFFSVAYTSSSAGTSTFTVTRTLPSQTTATTDPQHVYYRTLNGTAIGGAAEAVHFLHAGGEDVYAAFASTDMSKTFTVTGENISAVYKQDGDKKYAGTAFTGNAAPATQSAQTRTRYYEVELYKVLSTQKNCVGFVDAEKSRARRTLTVDDAHYLTRASLYGSWRSAYVTDKTTEHLVVDDSDYLDNYSQFAVPIKIWNEEQGIYLKQTATNLLWRTVFNSYEKIDGYQYVGFCPDNGTRGDWSFDMPKTGQWYENCILPYATENSGIASIRRAVRPQGTGTGEDTLTFDSANNGFYIPISVNKIAIRFAAGGNGEDDWYYKALRQEARPVDNNKSKQIGLAPMAFGELKQGDTVTLSLVFDELINSVTNLTAQDLTVNGLPLTGLKYVDGAGTNVLTFTATVGALTGGSFTINTAFNDKVIFQQLKLSGKVTDLCGNTTTFSG